MIHNLRVRNFQSLHDIDVALLNFTVIVGPSSSGKSAFTRALRTLVSNRRGTEWITHGERTATITAQTNAGTVTLTRSRSSASADNAYVLTPIGNPEDQRTYAKLGGDTPEDVSRFLGINSGSSNAPPIQFAGQFDKPFLLDDSAAEVARTLGALTNVNVIFEGARESNRQKLANASTLKLRASDLERIKERIPEFKALRAQDDALVTAEAIIEKARLLERQLTRLAEYVSVIETTEPTIERLRPLASLTVPDETPILAAQEAYRSFQQTLSRVPTLAREAEAAQEAYDAIEAQEATLLEKYSALTGEVTSDLRTFMASFADPAFMNSDLQGRDFIELDHAVKIFIKYLETKAG